MSLKPKAKAAIYTIIFTTGFAYRLILGSSPPVYAEKTNISDVSSKAKGIYINFHTQNEIRNYIQNNTFDIYEKPSYDIEPSFISPYSPGTLSESYLKNTLNALNTVRFIAGIDEVSLHDEYNKATQAASFINSLNHSISHFPAQPSGIPAELYHIGHDGAGCSNLAMGFSNIADSIINGYMYDDDNSNIQSLGHRRWCLNPFMEYTGFGIADRYSAMFAFDENYNKTRYYGISWPAPNMPTGYFNSVSPWSISMGYDVDISKVKVTLIRESDMKSWNFSKEGADGVFYVNNDGFGQSGCIIFRPDNISKYNDGDVYSVNISGLKEPVSYRVAFFDEKKSAFEGNKKGDANMDGIINAADLIVYSGYILLSYDISENGKKIMDINGDLKVNVIDLTALKKMLLDSK